MKQKYAIVDLETTGGIPKRDKITEIGIVLFDGTQIVEKFESLVNPQRTIPPHITRITGITNEMIEDAPKFFEIAKKVIEITEGSIFVAHNVRFDYQFLREEFKSLGFTFTRRNLCTVKLSRKAFPGLKSYSLGNLIRYFKIEVANRHRAYDDAWATTIILKKIFENQNSTSEIKDLVNASLKLTKLPNGLKPEDIDVLPEACGVYYFSDSSNQICYIGKSKNIKERVKQHFGKQTKKTDRMFKEVTQISFEITGSELASLVLESKEIKKELPQINKIQKTRDYKYAVIKASDKSGYGKYKIVKSDKAESPLSYYGSRKSALNHIEQIGETFSLCHKINGIDNAQHSCFNHSIGKCLGGCIGEEPPVYYNERFEESANALNRLFEENFYIVDEGRTQDEKAIILVENGHYQGFGYLSTEDAILGIEELKECIKYEKINPEADMIIRNYIWSNPRLEVCHF